MYEGFMEQLTSEEEPECLTNLECALLQEALRECEICPGLSGGCNGECQACQDYRVYKNEKNRVFNIRHRLKIKGLSTQPLNPREKKSRETVPPRFRDCVRYIQYRERNNRNVKNTRVVNPRRKVGKKARANNPRKKVGKRLPPIPTTNEDQVLAIEALL